MEVVFHGGRLPSFQNVPYWFELYYSKPKIVRKQVLLISCYFKLFPAISSWWGHLPLRMSSMEVIFHLFKISFIVLSSNRVDLQLVGSIYLSSQFFWDTVNYFYVLKRSLTTRKYVDTNILELVMIHHTEVIWSIGFISIISKRNLKVYYLFRFCWWFHYLHILSYTL